MIGTMTRMATALSLAIGCTTPDAPRSAYAEAVYDTYEQAAGGAIDLAIAAIEDGALSAIAERPLLDILGGLPAEWIVFHARGPEIVELARSPRDAATDEWIHPPALADFEAMGYPVAQGAYRLFDVSATIDGVTTQHRALEVCWADHCLVVDPVVMQLDGFYRNRQRLLADAWMATEIADDDDPADASAAAVRSCKLARYGTVSKRFTWPAQYAAGYNILGWTLYENHLGTQEVSIRCYVSGTSCRAAASSISYGSSCATFFPGWNCDCDNIDHFGYTGSTARSAAQTKCVNNFLGASIDASISGAGASFSVKWTASSGSLFTNGSTYTDTCVWQ